MQPLLVIFHPSNSASILLDRAMCKSHIVQVFSNLAYSRNCSLLANILHSKCRWHRPSDRSSASRTRRRWAVIRQTVSKKCFVLCLCLLTYRWLTQKKKNLKWAEEPARVSYSTMLQKGHCGKRYSKTLFWNDEIWWKFFPCVLYTVVASEAYLILKHSPIVA